MERETINSMHERDVFCCEVIITSKSRRGKGVEHDPVRSITEVYTKEGQKIAEYDPMPDTFTRRDMLDFTAFATASNLPVDDKCINEWLDSLKV